MADMTFKETCPCGDSVDISAYGSWVQPQIESWRKIHKKHMDQVAKAIAEAKAKAPVWYYWPYQNVEVPGANPWPNNPIITFDTNTATGVTTQRHG